MANYKLNDEKMFADTTDGITIIINSQTGVYYGMNTFGSQIFENIIHGVSTEKILELFNSWNISMVDDFNKYLNFLLDNEILLPDSESDSRVNIDENIAKNDNYVPKVEEYLDAQELLLADPIHEVNEDCGWSPDKSSLNDDKEDVGRREAKMNV